MKNYNKVIAAVVAGIVCSAATSHAALSSLSPGGGVTLSGEYTPNGTTIATLTSQYDVWSSGIVGLGNEDKGSITTTVIQGDSNNPLAGLTFVYTIALAIGDVTGLTVNGYGLPVDVANLTGTTTDALSAGYNAFGGINFAWLSSGADAPQTLSVVVATSSPAFGINPANIQDAAAANGLPIYAPVPEPTTIAAGLLMLLPFGIGAARSLRKDRTA